MANWSPTDWITFLTALGSFVTLAGGVIVTIILQIKGNRKTESAKTISADNNDKLAAVISQTNEIAAATPGASTLPTDHIVAASRAQGA